MHNFRFAMKAVKWNPSNSGDIRRESEVLRRVDSPYLVKFEVEIQNSPLEQIYFVIEYCEVKIFHLLIFNFKLRLFLKKF